MESLWAISAVIAILIAAVGGCGRPAAPAHAAARTAEPEPPFCHKSPSRRAGVVVFDEPTMTRPRLLENPAPMLTKEIREKNLQGEVILKCVLAQSGSLEDCCIAEGIAGLNGPVFAAVRRWRYEPVLRHGKPIDVEYEIKVVIIVQ